MTLSVPEQVLRIGDSAEHAKQIPEKSRTAVEKRRVAQSLAVSATGNRNLPHPIIARGRQFDLWSDRREKVPLGRDRREQFG